MILVDKEKVISNPHENPLAYEPVGKLLLKFAVPGMIAMLVNSLYNIADQIFVGHGVGTLGIGATTVGYTVSTIGLACALLCGAGGSALSAIRLGEGKQREAEQILGASSSLSVITSLLVSVVIILSLTPTVKFFGATPANLPHSKMYVSILLIGLPFTSLSTSISNFLRVAGKPVVSMLIMLCGAGINTLLDAWMVLGLHMGVAGAAIATVISQIISAVISVIYIKNRGNLRLRFKFLKFDPRLTIPIFSMGFSSFITQIGFSILQIVQNRSLVHYGALVKEVGADIAVSSMGVVSKLCGVLIAFVIGIATGAQPIVGFNYGMKNYSRIKKTYLYAVIWAVATATLGEVLTLLVPDQIISIFGGGDRAFHAFASTALKISFAAIFCSGFQIVSSNFFQAIGQPFKAAVFSMSRQLIILIPLTLVLPLFMGLNGVFYAIPLADILSAGIVAAFIIPQMRKFDRETAKAENKTAVAD